MDTFYPDYKFQPLLVPQGFVSSTDSMAQVVHGYLTLANSLEDYIKWIFILPSDWMANKMVDDFHFKQRNLEDYDLWEVQYVLSDKFEIYDPYKVIVNVTVIDDGEWYSWNSILKEVELEPYIIFMKDVNYIDSAAEKDFSSGYLRKKFVLNTGVVHCFWNWEISDDSELHKMSVLLNDMRRSYWDWPPPENSPLEEQTFYKTNPVPERCRFIQ